MSHNVVINSIKITNLDCLKAAVKELQDEGIKVALDEGARNFRTYYGQKNQCDLAIKLPTEQYDVGLIKQPDGSYAPVFDHMLSSNKQIACEWSPGDKVDERQAIGKLVQRYSVVLTEREAALQGHCCTRQKTEDGSIHVVVEMGE